MQQRGVIGHLHVVVALLAERREVTEQFHPLAPVVADFHATYTVVGVTVVIDAVIVEMGHDLVERAHMGGEHIVALGVLLALRLGGEVISADSMQLYRGMDIGTAKATPEERSEAVHHMLDVADPFEDFSAASDFAADALDDDVTGIHGFYHSDIIKVITGIRRSGKSKLLDAFNSLISKEDNSNVVRINLNQKQYKKLLNADNLYEYIEKQHVAGRDNYLFIDEI